MGISSSGAGESSRCRLPLPSPSVPAQPSSFEVSESSEECESSDNVEYHQLVKDDCEVQEFFSSARLNAEMLCSEQDAARDALQASRILVSQARGDLMITQGQAQHMANLIMVLRMWVETLQLSMLATYNAAFLIGIVDNLYATEEHLDTLPAHLRAMMTEGGPAR